jgi:hypothetical protein
MGTRENLNKEGEVPRALGCAILILVPGTLLALILLAFSLMMRGEITIRPSQWLELRIWLVNQRDNQGLGASLTRRMRAGPEPATLVCETIKARFLLWRSDGTARPVDFCECLLEDSGEVQPVSPCPP